MSWGASTNKMTRVQVRRNASWRERWWWYEGAERRASSADDDAKRPTRPSARRRVPLALMFLAVSDPGTVIDGVEGFKVKEPGARLNVAEKVDDEVSIAPLFMAQGLSVVSGTTSSMEKGP